MDEKDLQQLAEDIFQGKVFGSWMLNDPKRLGNIFLPLGLEGGEKFANQDIWGIYEYRHKTSHFTQDGLPIFTSFKTLSSIDCQRLNPLIKKMFMEVIGDGEKERID